MSIDFEDYSQIFTKFPSSNLLQLAKLGTSGLNRRDWKGGHKPIMPPYYRQKEMDIFSREKHAFMDREQSRLLYPGRSPGRQVLEGLLVLAYRDGFR